MVKKTSEDRLREQVILLTKQKSELVDLLGFMKSDFEDIWNMAIDAGEFPVDVELPVLKKVSHVEVRNRLKVPEALAFEGELTRAFEKAEIARANREREFNRVVREKRDKLIDSLEPVVARYKVGVINDMRLYELRVKAIAKKFDKK